ncbi:MucBP domain-containing protein, partial [Lactococcus petauri]|uniref:MucBP domain-containing protein n=1 Tax=Lactococcus petauri TaxID=1940789 RepID=UPI0032678E46
MTNKKIRTSSQWLLIILLITSSILPGVSDSVAATTDAINNSQSIDSMQAESEEAVDEWMPDKQLQIGVAKALGINVEELTKEKMLDLGTTASSKSVQSSGVDNLQGLELATNSQNMVLVFKDGNLSDLSPLKNLSISQLVLSNNNITDLTPLRGKYFSLINLDNNDIYDVSPLSSGGIINIERNHISDISSVYGSMVMARYQTISNLPIEKTNSITIDSVRHARNYDFAPSNFNISNDGLYNVTATNGGEIIWNDLDSSVKSVQYEFDRQYSYLEEDSKENNQVYFTGTVTQPFINNNEAALVTVSYVDEEGNPIPNVSSQTISGNIGDSYDASTDAYKLIIEGYTLDESKLPTNAKGTLSDQAQTVTYVYTKNPVKAADVTVNYVDEDGKAIPSVSSQTISGNIGDSYDASTDAYKLIIEGYTLDESKLPTNAKGTLSDQAQTVTYVYTKNPVKAADVTVNYVDEDGKAIPSVSPQTISGNIGDSYDASTDAYKLIIEGYTLDE